MKSIIDNIAKVLGYTVLIALSSIGISIFSHYSLKYFGNCYLNYHKYNKQEGNEKEVLAIQQSVKGWIGNIIFHDNSSFKEEVKYTTRKIKCKCGKHIIEYKDDNKWKESTDFFDKYYK